MKLYIKTYPTEDKEQADNDLKRLKTSYPNYSYASVVQDMNQTKATFRAFIITR